MRIAGIDPGYARIGYALVVAEGNAFRCEDAGTWEILAKTPAGRLAELERKASSFFAGTYPDRIGIERLFFSSNRATAMGVAEARGVILLTAIKTGATMVELAPNEVKRALTGNGNATKAAVAKMVRWILGTVRREKFDDASDAIAIAIAASRRIV